MIGSRAHSAGQGMWLPLQDGQSKLGGGAGDTQAWPGSHSRVGAGPTAVLALTPPHVQCVLPACLAILVLAVQWAIGEVHGGVTAGSAVLACEWLCMESTSHLLHPLAPWSLASGVLWAQVR